MDKYSDISDGGKRIKVYLRLNDSPSHIYTMKYIEDFYKIFQIKYKEIYYGINFVPNIDINDYYYLKMSSLNANKQDYEYLKKSIFLNQWSINDDLMDSCYELLCSNFIYEVPEYKEPLINKCLYFGADENIDIEDCINKKPKHIQEITTNMVSVLFKELNKLTTDTYKLIGDNKQVKKFAKKMYFDYIDLIKETKIA